jgi:hypothetical protein
MALPATTPATNRERRALAIAPDVWDEDRALGLRGELQWLPVSSLNVDPTYQRPISTRHLNKIIAEFDGDLIGVILVSERTSGERYILDGQHRVEAVRLLGFPEGLVPCMVYTHLEAGTEAKMFAEANKRRLSLHPFYTFRARLLGGDESAIALRDLVDSYGFHLEYGRNLPGESGMGRLEGKIQALGELEKLQTDYATPMVGPVLDLVASVWGSEVIGLSGTLLRGLATFLFYFGELAEMDRVKDILRDMTIKRLENEGRDQPGRLEVGITRVIVSKYNYQLGAKRRLPERQIRRH